MPMPRCPSRDARVYPNGVIADNIINIGRTREQQMARQVLRFVITVTYFLATGQATRRSDFALRVFGLPAMDANIRH
jgi:hypothetical protein